jgi:hypothetical protein
LWRPGLKPGTILLISTSYVARIPGLSHHAELDAILLRLFPICEIHSFGAEYVAQWLSACPACSKIWLAGPQQLKKRKKSSSL